ncbi:MAG: hypothetical protein KGJ59_00305 [Bacteroidota bacterium]|nr:hypothetical protein [Bacteroidota bacterium]
MIRFFICLVFVSVFLFQFASGQNSVARNDELAYRFNGGYGQVEVGSWYAGAEFHGSRPLPSRISFYYPVANSIDLSTDYWKRGDSQPFAVGVKIGNEKIYSLGKNAWTYTVSPHTVMFQKREGDIAYEMTYAFCLNEPAMVWTLKMHNAGGQKLPVEIYTHVKTSVRTCQTYARIDSAATRYDSTAHTIVADFDELGADSASVFVENGGLMPISWTTDAIGLAVHDDGTSEWLTDSSSVLSRKIFPHGGKGNTVAAFLYQTELQPGASASIVQIVGSCRRNDVGKIVSTLKTKWRKEIDAYDDLVRAKAFDEAHFFTGDNELDRSAAWARALLATNAHYIDGSIQPMPCPAEYNFYFTHDVLLTNLGAVNFDLTRVKKNLLFIVSHAKDGIIPHAYYWRDDGFKTEYCTPDNWNHLWFILVNGSYLRHSGDDSTAQELYPLVTKSLEEILTQRKPDNLMYAYRPDWWDIGHVEGSRSFITVLAIRALREYLYLSSALKVHSSKLNEYEAFADAMEKSMNEHLWDPQLKFLINYNGSMKDSHYYVGSLLAPVFGELGISRSKELVASAEKELLSPAIGIHVVSPADFNSEASKKFFKFVDNEAGDPYVYINGGIWSQANAMYAMDLKAVGEVDEAVDFVKRVMAIDGVAHSPMGVPAMYEYRFSDSTSKEFGKIDKPSFLWAGGFYLTTLYKLFGVQENEWNVSFAGPLPSTLDSASYTLAVGRKKDVVISGKGKYLHELTFSGKEIPSLVIPENAMNATKCAVIFGMPEHPYLQSVNAVLNSAHYDKTPRVLSLQVSSFCGHHITVVIVTPEKIRHVLVDKKKVKNFNIHPLNNGLSEVTLHFSGNGNIQNMEIFFVSL